jgi:2-aminoethylphosphonate transport system ATP-binding protein
VTEIGVSQPQGTAQQAGELRQETLTPAITFDRVGVSYGRGRKATQALIDFNLRVAAGETVALLGPSGSGKSTALNALAGFVRPTSGTVRLGGRDVTDLPPAKRGIGVVLQSYALFPHMRVAENVAFGGANLIPCTVGRVIGTSALVTIAHKTVSAEAPQPATGKFDWAPESKALLCVRPHAMRIVSLGERDALRATVTAAVWRGATTRLVLSVGGLRDQLIDIDAPGNAQIAIGSEVGVRLPEPAGVLVQPS